MPTDSLTDSLTGVKCRATSVPEKTNEWKKASPLASLFHPKTLKAASFPPSPPQTDTGESESLQRVSCCLHPPPNLKAQVVPSLKYKWARRKQNFEERLFNFPNGPSLDIIKLSKYHKTIKIFCDKLHCYWARECLDGVSEGVQSYDWFNSWEQLSLFPNLFILNDLILHFHFP